MGTSFVVNVNHALLLVLPTESAGRLTWKVEGGVLIAALMCTSSALHINHSFQAVHHAKGA